MLQQPDSHFIFKFPKSYFWFMQKLTIFYKTHNSNSFVIHDTAKLNLMPRIGETLDLEFDGLSKLFRVTDIIHATKSPFIDYADIQCVEI